MENIIKIQRLVVETNSEDLKLAEIQRDIVDIRDNNRSADILMKFQDGKLLSYYLTEKKLWQS